MAADPPPDLVRRVARQETLMQAARDQYTYRQTLTVEELDSRGARAGEYREVRDVTFSPNRERIEQVVGTPRSTLQRLILTDEDFRDLRDIQPFVIPEDRLWMYDTKFRGEQTVDSMDCWVLQVRPRQILQGQRLFDGLLFIDKQTYSVVRMEGQAVPQIINTKQENLFPHFTTVRRSIDGKYWFPTVTYADDILYFRGGPVRERLTIRYTGYRRFGAESSITYENK